MRPATIFASAWLLLAAACGDDGVEKTWDEEIIIQLFKSKTAEFGSLTLQASSGLAAPVKKEINEDGKLFADCGSNQLRILPRKVGAVYPDVTVKVTTGLPFGADVLAQALVKVPAREVVKMVLAKGKDMEPAACAPTVTLDALGDGCLRDDDCQDGKCLKRIVDEAGTYTFNLGYCTKSCAGLAKCPAGSKCATFGLLGQTTHHYCLKQCPAGNMDCRAAQGYKCTGGAVCLPDPVK